MCPPHGQLGNLYTKALAVIFVWAVLWAITGELFELAQLFAVLACPSQPERKYDMRVSVWIADFCILL